MRLFITVYSILLILSTWILSFVLQCVFWLVSKPFLPRARQTYLLGAIFRGVSGLVTLLNPWWRFTLHGSLPKERPQKLVIMSNHVSNLDPFITCRALLPWNACYIAKSDLFKVPFGGWCMSLAGDIPVYFTKEKGGWGLAKGSVGKMMETCKWLVSNGVPLMVFPEGARSGSMELREFKAGMFTFSLEQGCTILPLALNNTHRAWSRNDVLDSADIHVAIGEPIVPKEGETVDQLKDRVRAEIVRLTATLPNTAQDEPTKVKPVTTATATATAAGEEVSTNANKEQ
jgi:1-acyl-sn-glycerol-3-phosphate acyltransferase